MGVQGGGSGRPRPPPPLPPRLGLSYFCRNSVPLFPSGRTVVGTGSLVAAGAGNEQHKAPLLPAQDTRSGVP